VLGGGFKVHLNWWGEGRECEERKWSEKRGKRGEKVRGTRKRGEN